MAHRLRLSFNVINIFDKRHYAYVDNAFTTDAPGRELDYKW